MKETGRPVAGAGGALSQPPRPFKVQGDVVFLSKQRPIDGVVVCCQGDVLGRALPLTRAVGDCLPRSPRIITVVACSIRLGTFLSPCTYCR